MDTPRDRQTRKTDTLRKLETEPDVWVATSDTDGAPYLVPLSLAWDGGRVVVCASSSSRTIKNLLRSGVGRLALGLTRDVVMLDVIVAESWSAREVPGPTAENFKQRARWDPRDEPGDYTYIALEPRRIQAWREANELSGRALMRDGAWLD